MRITVDAPGRPLTIDDGQLDGHRARLESLGNAAPSRRAYAAVHVVMRTDYAQLDHRLDRPGTPEAIAESIDWLGTMELRRRLDARGFGIAEAMDTAQRFFLGWPSAERLIRECGALDLEHGFIAGAGVDHLATVGSTTQLVDGVVDEGPAAYEDWPYKTVVEAIADGWCVIRFPAELPSAHSADGHVICEFILEK